MKKVIDIRSYAKKIFMADEIKEVVISGYKYETSNKISVKVPVKHADKLASVMADAGAGIIGRYKSCSFRINGTGTFKPASRSNPFTGNKNKINYVEEVKLEMRCPDANVDDVVNAIQKDHPYEEPDYDITQIKFRGKTPESVFIKLKKAVTAEDLFKRLNKNIHSFSNKKKISSLVITNNSEAVLPEADAIIFASEFIKLKFK